MKTIKAVLITATFFFAMVTMVNAEHASKIDPSKRTISLTFEQAMQNPGLVTAMYQQIHNDFLNSGINRHTYTQTVSYNGYNFRITGTYNQWKLFFRYQYIVPNTHEIKT